MFSTGHKKNAFPRRRQATHLKFTVKASQWNTYMINCQRINEKIGVGNGSKVSKNIEFVQHISLSLMPSDCFSLVKKFVKFHKRRNCYQHVSDFDKR